ncbi:TonB-dependent receptor [Pseudoxanthomonas kalamensis DSM 18571]|uniref:TonB-dependent receptor domain-containing protein n=1 Tax=Pseudoxanthomonas kalamensis TaxID=289483 RepID=UPI001390DE3F|nr:TonB-dependent receptor [Pseudoxanthomonas kalamensis]KAF1711181.1 TonB-dependent receptor [Pseudoxanthomonas kalamensis DSM 18571]
MNAHSRRFPSRTLLACAVVALLPLPALADDAADATDLDPVVVTATGFEQKITDAPASISVITREELEKRPYMTLIDAVRDLEGIDVGETSDKTGQKTISMRGMGADYTLILVDGKRQNNHGDIYPNNFGGNQFNHIPPLDMIERIEVIRGPASTLYGADALGGVINIITRKVSDRWRGSATLSHNVQENDDFGSDSTLDFALMGPLAGDTLGLGIRGSRYERNASEPEYEVVYDPAGEPHERSLGFGGGGKTVDNTNTSAGITLTWKPDDRQSLQFDLDRSEQEYDNTPYLNNLGTETYPLGTVDSITTIWRASGGNVAPRVGYTDSQEFTRNQWSLVHNGQWEFGNSFVSLAWIDTENNGRTLPFSVEERLLLQQMYDASGDYAGLSLDERKARAEAAFLPRPKRTMESSQYTLDVKLDIPVQGWGGYHHFVVGGQAIDGELEDGVFGMESGGYGNGTVQEHRMWSLFAEDNWSPIDPLTITLGLRHDDHNLFGGHLSPRAYAVYELAPNWTLKGGVSTGYKTPKTTDLYDGITGFGGQGTSPWAGNPDLQPETSVNSEIALYWTSADGVHNFNITAFHNDFEDKIERAEVSQSCTETGGVRPCVNLGEYWAVLGTGNVNQYINVDKARIQGVEVAGRWQIIEPLSLRANYTYTDSERKSGDDAGLPLAQSAKHMANATLDWTVSDRFGMQLIGEMRSRRYRGSTDDDGNPLYYKRYDVLHLAAQYRFNEHVSLNGRINNLLDEDFTSFETTFSEDGLGGYTLTYLDDYNNKDKARNYWLSLHISF